MSLSGKCKATRLLPRNSGLIYPEQICKQLDEMIIKQFKAMEIINKSAK